MAKQVTVEYKCEEDCHTFTEECYLLDDFDNIYIDADDESGIICLGTVEENSVLLGVRYFGLVMFEDEDGLFGLLPEQIISIKER